MKLRYLLFFFAALICTEFIQAQGVKVIAPIITNASTDEYPTHIDSLGMGGFMSVPNLTVRNSIPALRRKKGMMVYVTETDQLFQLKLGVENANWVALSISGGGSGSFSWLGNAVSHPASPNQYSAYYNTTDKISYIWDGDSWEILARDGATGPQGIQGIQGPAGTNGVSLSWQGSLATAPGSPTLNMAYYNTADKRSYVWDGDSWEILSQDGSDGATGSQGPQGIQGIQGPAGTNGVSLSWQGSLATAPGSSTLNMAYYNTADKRSYVWDGDSWEILSQDGSDGATGSQGPQGIQGIQGPAGTNGVSLSWQGSLATAPGSPTLNMAYYNTADKRSYVWDGDSWEILSQDGSAGAQGIQGLQGIQGIQGPAGTNGVSLSWQGSLATAPGSPTLNMAYYNTADKRSYVWDGDSWEILSQDGSDGATGSQGPQGIQGIQGPAGTNGVSLSWQGSLATAPGSPTLNMAYYNTADKRSYVWDGDSWEILSQDGSDGAQGLQGPQGPQGIQGLQGLQGPAGTNGVGIEWVGDLATAPAEQLNRAYYNTTDKRSYIYNGTEWKILAKDGADGGGSTSPFDGSRPITQTGLPVTNFNPQTNDIAEWIQKVFYPTTAPSATLTASLVHPKTGSTVNSSGGTIEIDRVATGVNIDVTLNWGATRSATTAALATITVAGQSQSFTPPPAGSSVNGTANTTIARNANITLSNQVVTTDGKASPNANVNIRFSDKIYYGFMDAHGGVANGDGNFVPTDVEIQSLANQSYATTRILNSVGSGNPTGSQRLVIAFPASYDNNTKILLGGFESTDAFEKHTKSFTNASDGVLNYVVFVHKSNTAQAFTIKIE